MHEYAHAKKQRYFAFNYLSYFSIAMSYNPLIQIVKRKMIHDNEVEADRFVLNNINKYEFKSYAEAIMDSVLKNLIFQQKIY